jgi:hypothetical protein
MLINIIDPKGILNLSVVHQVDIKGNTAAQFAGLIVHNKANLFV